MSLPAVPLDVRFLTLKQQISDKTAFIFAPRFSMMILPTNVGLTSGAKSCLAARQILALALFNTLAKFCRMGALFLKGSIMTEKTTMTPADQHYLTMFEHYLASQNYLDDQGKPTPHYKKRVRSLKAFLRGWRGQFGKPFGGSIRPEMITQVLDYLHENEKRSHDTLDEDLAGLRAFWRCLMAQSDSKMTVNLAEGLTAPGLPKSKRQKLAKGPISPLIHEMSLGIDDELHEYILIFAKGRSRQEAIRRMIEEHRSFQGMATALQIREQIASDLAKLFEAQLEQIKELLFDETLDRDKSAMAMHTFMMCMLMVSSGKNAEYMFDATGKYLTAYFERLYPRLSEEIEAVKLLPQVQP